MDKKKRILTVVLSVLCLALFTTGCGKVNVGYVDQTRVQNEAPQIKASMDEMKTQMTNLQTDAEKQFKEAQEKNASQEDMQKLQQQLQMQAAGIQQTYATQMKAKIDAAMDDIAKEKKLDTVLNSNAKDGVVITGGTDVTDEVIQKLQ